MQIKSAHSRATLHSLPWDSRHFGFPVSRLDGPELDEAELEDALASARRGKVNLVYYSAEPGRNIPQHILDEFSGLLVDRRAIFQHNLRNVVPNGHAPTPCLIREHPRRELGPGLLRLAVEAGVCSRFQLDPRIPKELFERLYENWIVRSVRGELADLVLIGDTGTPEGDPTGLITVSVTDGQGSIGLIAVREFARGQGIGASLIHTAHRWLLGRGAKHVTVVTQLENHAACRLYERCGYQNVELRDRYHFWP